MADMRPTSGPRGANNYFRVHGTTETFPFDDQDDASVQAALSAAKDRAMEFVGTKRTPPILVWRRSPCPETRSLSVIGEPFVYLVN